MYHCIQRERKDASKKVKGGPFKLNSHPNDVFDANPYKTDKPQPVYWETKRSGEKPRPFKPSNPAKLVSPWTIVYRSQALLMYIT